MAVSLSYSSDTTPPNPECTNRSHSGGAAVWFRNHPSRWRPQAGKRSTQLGNPRSVRSKKAQKGRILTGQSGGSPALAGARQPVTASGTVVFEAKMAAPHSKPPMVESW